MTQGGRRGFEEDRSVGRPGEPTSHEVCYLGPAPPKSGKCYHAGTDPKQVFDCPIEADEGGIREVDWIDMRDTGTHQPL